MALLGLRFCARAFSSCGKWGPLFIVVRGPFTIAVSPVAEHRLQMRSTGSRCAGSVIVAHGPSCSAACRIFPDQGLNLCPLHWQADSQPLHHQGSPNNFSLSLIFVSLITMSQRVSPWVYPAWDSLNFLDLGGYFFSHVREVFDYNLFKYFLGSFLSLFSFWDPYNVNVGAFNVVLEVS